MNNGWQPTTIWQRDGGSALQAGIRAMGADMQDILEALSLSEMLSILRIISAAGYRSDRFDGDYRNWNGTVWMCAIWQTGLW